ncbi:hypothetical protein JTB14_011563 [Gonioctena quinquepunctata]|nr:hypothetical protein JTB14_011563 [Gonioctena quinquepunctata]
MSGHRNIETCKAYLCISVSLATGAIQLELASSLSTDIFLAALQRFIARRGRISDIYSDQSINFVGASREPIHLMKGAATHETVNSHSNPASSPHFSGLWKAGVKFVKNNIARVMEQHMFTYEEFYTVLVLIESILNLCPSIPMSADRDDVNALTPGH